MRYSSVERLADLEALRSAATPDDLHRALVLGVPACVANEVTAPVRLLRQVHAADPTRVGDTVVLLATDPRWKSVRGLMAALADSGLVAGDVLDVVAEAFVHAGECVWWRCPQDWFDEWVTVELDGVGDDEAAAPIEDEDASGEVVVRREVPVDARRWAVHRFVAADPPRWPAMLRRAADAPRSVASGLLLGLLDSAEVVGGPAMRVVERAALASSDMTVRHAGLRRLAERDRVAALALAAADPNQRIRAWAGRLPPDRVPKPQPAADTPTHDAVERDVADGGQASLF